MQDRQEFDFGKVATDLIYKYADARLNKYQRPRGDIIPRGGETYAASQSWRPPMLLPPAAPAYTAPAPMAPVIDARRSQPPMWKNPLVLAGGALALVLVLIVLKSR